MKSKIHNLTIFRSITGKTTVSPKPEPENPAGYQESKVRDYQRYEGMI